LRKNSVLILFKMTLKIHKVVILKDQKKETQRDKINMIDKIGQKDKIDQRDKIDLTNQIDKIGNKVAKKLNSWLLTLILELVKHNLENISRT